MKLRIIYIGIKTQIGVWQSLGQVWLNVSIGIAGDRFNDDPNKQISILVKRADEVYAEDKSGFCRTRFKPNLILETTNQVELCVNARLTAGDCELEITIAGKECHPSCPLYDKSISCEMHKDIYFAKVVKNGEIRLYDELFIRQG